MAIELEEFRQKAQDTCVEYLGLKIYMDPSSYPDMGRLSLPTWSQQGAGPLYELMSSIANMDTQIEQINKGHPIRESRRVDGVNYNAAKNDVSLNVKGTIYCLTYDDYKSTVTNLERLAREHGWYVNTTEIGGVTGVTYQPKKAGYGGGDPLEATVKTMALSAVRDLRDSISIATAQMTPLSKWYSENNPVEATANRISDEYDNARIRQEGMSMFSSMKISFYGNLPSGTIRNWLQLSKTAYYRPTIKVIGQNLYQTNVGYMPTSITYKPHDFVRRNGQIFATAVSVDINMSNPLASIFSAYSTDGTVMGPSFDTINYDKLDSVVRRSWKGKYTMSDGNTQEIPIYGSTSGSGRG